ncbi:MAG TPA: hypothetical protein VMJ30_09650 [Gemmatimonadales bacterium]|nr:hypothetical protein [Gemmatimonadales bacterium]
MGSGPVSARDRLAWMSLGGAIVGALALVLYFVSRNGTPAQPVADAPSAPFAAGVGGAAEAPPDISQMSPRERFDRLYNRIMKAAETGNESEVTRFTPMALMAYQQLDTVDADARFHAALLKLHTGDVAGARALGDTVLKQNPGHLFGYIILGTVARWSKDEADLKRQYAAVLKHYDAEVKADRPEYQDHARSLADFKKAAEEQK